jgi:hypothetical protein
LLEQNPAAAFEGRGRSVSIIIEEEGKTCDHYGCGEFISQNDDNTLCFEVNKKKLLTGRHLYHI